MISRNNLRTKLGEKWNEYQRLRKNLKALRYKVRNVDSVINWRRKAKKILIEYKGGKCERCKYDKSEPVAFDFHHKDPKQKDFRIGGSTRSIARLKEEVDKCELLCKICHAVEHKDNNKMSREEHLDSLNLRIKDIENQIKMLGVELGVDISERQQTARTRNEMSEIQDGAIEIEHPDQD